MRLKRTRLMDRKENVRDASLFVVATEGQETERQYFEGFRSPRLHVEVLPTGLDGASSPDRVLERLAEFRDRYDLAGDDQLWLVVDVDRWGDRKLSEVCGSARSRGFETAVSNPCFELWLYLHFSDHDLTGPEWVALVDGHKGNVSGAMEARLRERLAEHGGYQKSNLVFSRFRPRIPDAIERARALHADPDERWPRALPGTHVYRLAERLLPLLSRDAGA
jgi:hypothetical protein